MADAVYIAIALGFFALCVLYVEWCDRIIGADDSAVEITEITEAVADQYAADQDAEARGGVSA